MKSYLLVAIQFGLLGFLVWYGGTIKEIIPVIFWFAGGLLGVWAIFVMRFRVSVLPEVRKNQNFIVVGPYHVVRHPMYTAVLLVGLACVLYRTDIFSVGAWLVLLTDLVVKLRYEEGLLREKFPGYSAYATRTWRLVPWLY